MRRRYLDEKKEKEREEREEREREWGIRTFAAVLSAFCAVILCWMCADSQRYHGMGEDVMVSGITYTPPKQQEPPGVWEIFEEAVKSLAFWE